MKLGIDRVMGLKIGVTILTEVEVAIGFSEMILC